MGPGPARPLLISFWSIAAHKYTGGQNIPRDHSDARFELRPRHCVLSITYTNAQESPSIGIANVGVGGHTLWLGQTWHPSDHLLPSGLHHFFSQ